MANNEYYDASTNKWRTLDNVKSTPNSIATSVITTTGVQDLSEETTDVAIVNGESLSTTLSKMYTGFVLHVKAAQKQNEELLALIGNLKDSALLLKTDYTLLQDDAGKLITCQPSDVDMTISLLDGLKIGSSFSIINTSSSNKVIIKNDAQKIIRYNQYDTFSSEITLDQGDRITLSTDGDMWYEISSSYCRQADIAINDSENQKITETYLNKQTGGTVTGPVTVTGKTSLASDALIVDDVTKKTELKGDAIIGTSPTNTLAVAGTATFANNVNVTGRLIVNDKTIFKKSAEFCGSSGDPNAKKLIVANNKITFSTDENGDPAEYITAKKYTGTAANAEQVVGTLKINCKSANGEGYNGSKDMELNMYISDIGSDPDYKLGSEVILNADIGAGLDENDIHVIDVTELVD